METESEIIHRKALNALRESKKHRSVTAMQNAAAALRKHNELQRRNGCRVCELDVEARDIFTAEVNDLY